jgi:hypothetical protein
MKTKLEAWVPFDDDFEIKVAHLSREELGKIRNAALRISFNPKSRQKEETVDSDIFIKEFVKAAVLDWKGLTLEKAMSLLPIEVPSDVDTSVEVEYSQENALELAKNSPVFDGWLNDVVLDLEGFRARGAGQVLGNPGQISEPT